MQIGPLSPEAFGRRADLDRRTVAALEAVAPEDVGADGVLRTAALERLRSDLALDEVGFTRRLLAPLATPVHLVRQVFDGLPRAGDEDWQRVAAHLTEVPRAYEEYLATLTAAADDGHVVARRQVEAVAGQCDSWVASGYYADVAGAYGGGDAALRDALARGAQEATRATGRL
ncbi:MAG: DUF885 family protein, partial [Actinotalea sp.]|nr:DUF885 family protein [Actinotalea sp.]